MKTIRKPVVIETVNEKGRQFFQSKENKINSAIAKGDVFRDEGGLHFNSSYTVRNVLGIARNRVGKARDSKDGVMERPGIRITSDFEPSNSDSCDGAGYSSGSSSSSSKRKPGAKKISPHPRKRLRRTESDSDSEAGSDSSSSSESELG